ncbi:MAG: aconitate hydratase, partial [Planctomycetaceae bacterium]
MSTRYSKPTNIDLDGTDYRVYGSGHLDFPTARLPYSLKILLENLLRHGNETFVTDDDIEALANWDPQAEPDKE